MNKTTLLTLWRLLSARERQTVNSKIVSELITYNARRNAYYQNKERGEDGDQHSSIGGREGGLQIKWSGRAPLRR